MNMLMDTTAQNTPGAAPQPGKGTTLPLPLPSERYMTVSRHTAQAFRTPVAGRGFTTVKSGRACTCWWQVGCTNTRFSAPSLPPETLQTRWWQCHPVSWVILWVQIGQRPFCSFQR